MNLNKLKVLLAECHISSNLFKPFIISADSTYTYSRALEELENAKNETDPVKKDASLVKAIQLINITRYKLKQLEHESNDAV